MSEKDKEMLSMMTEGVSQMLKSLVLAPYTEDSAKQIAAAVVIFYNELKKKGISSTFAERLTEAYLGGFRISLGGTSLGVTSR